MFTQVGVIMSHFCKLLLYELFSWILGGKCKSAYRRVASTSYAIIVSKCCVGAHIGSLLLGVGHEQVMQ